MHGRKIHQGENGDGARFKVRVPLSGNDDLVVIEDGEEAVVFHKDLTSGALALNSPFEKTQLGRLSDTRFKESR